MNIIVDKTKELIYFAKIDELYMILEYLILCVPIEEIIYSIKNSYLEKEILEIEVINDINEAKYNISRFLIYLSINLSENDFTKVLEVIIALTTKFIDKNMIDEFETMISKY